MSAPDIHSIIVNLMSCLQIVYTCTIHLSLFVVYVFTNKLILDVLLVES